MCRTKQKDNSPLGENQWRHRLDGSIVDLFREHGEDYIRIYKPSHQKIKLIRSIRVCQSPALGGKRIKCKKCGKSRAIYLSCGNSQCPLCQNHKRNMWQSKLSKKLLNIPYVHTVFTTPRELNRLMRYNERLMYNIALRAAWECIKLVCSDEDNLGALPGMVTVLHTFGSDMKYHVHVHSLITFGGIDEQGNWKWPKRRKQLGSYRNICKMYRTCFLEMLNRELRQGRITPVEGLLEVLEQIENKRWNVRNGYPTTETKIIERYLARYINRVAISKSRLEYVKSKEKVDDLVYVKYKDYRNQKDGQAAMIKTKSMNPLIAIHKFMTHVLPPYFQKSRYYGLHASITWKKYESKISNKLKRNIETVRNLFVLLKAMAKELIIKCEHCEHEEFETLPIRSDLKWIFNFITVPSYRGPPLKKYNMSYKN